MKIKYIFLSLASASVASGVIVTTSFTDLGTALSAASAVGSTSHTFTSAVSGVWGSGTLELTATALNGDALDLGSNAARLNGADDISFSVALTGLTVNADYTVSDTGFRGLFFTNAGNTDDSGTLTLPSGTTATWSDWNGGSDFTGHNSGSSILIDTVNGGTRPTSFTHTHEGGAYDYDELSVRFDYIYTEPVPEPTSAALLGLGGLALIARRKR